MFRDFLYYSKSDRRVIVLLALIAIFAVGVLLVLKRLSPSSSESVGDSTSFLSGRAGEGPEGEGVGIPTSFDPNTVDSATLVGFGLQPWKVRNFMHYRQAGKCFRSAEDLLNTYGWEEEDIERLRPYVDIHPRYLQPRQAGHSRYNTAERQRPHHTTDATGHDANRPSTDTGRPRYSTDKFTTLTLVDPNTADTTLLQRIPGIGSYYSRSIVRLRERLGGFYDLSQLFEIRNFPEEALPWFEISSQPIRLNLNTASFKVLAAHPYIGYQHTKAIQDYVRLYGFIDSKETLEATSIFTAEELERLLPYLEF